MSDILFNSDFAKNSKFEENFVGDILAIDEWLQLVSQFKNYYRQNKYEEINHLIPKKIHQIWLGKKGIPRKSIDWMQSWKKFNPDWEYILWDEEKIKELQVSEFNVYSKELNPGYRSDILRYIILNKFSIICSDVFDIFIFFFAFCGPPFCGSPFAVLDNPRCLWERTSLFASMAPYGPWAERPLRYQGPRSAIFKNI